MREVTSCSNFEAGFFASMAYNSFVMCCLGRGAVGTSNRVVCSKTTQKLSSGMTWVKILNLEIVLDTMMRF